MPEDAPAPTLDRALIRLEVIVEGLTKEMHRLNNIVQAQNGLSERRIEQHEKSVGVRLDGIETKLGKLSDKIEERSKFPWSIVLSLVGLLMVAGTGLGGFAISNLKDSDERNEKMIATVQQALVPRAEIDVRSKRVYEALDALSRRIESVEGRKGN